MSITAEFATEAELADRTPEGLTVARRWVRVGGCPVWRGYDPQPGSAHDLGELGFIEQMDARGLESDRCQCGGLAAWDDKHPDAARGAAPTVAHYPPEFLAETHGTEGG